MIAETNSAFGESSLPLEYRVKLQKARLHMMGLREERRFIDITHNASGKMCRVYYYPRTKKYEYEPIKD